MKNHVVQLGIFISPVFKHATINLTLESLIKALETRRFQLLCWYFFLALRGVGEAPLCF